MTQAWPACANYAADPPANSPAKTNPVAAPLYASLFDDTKVHTIRITLSADAAASLQSDPTSWTTADIEFDGEVIHKVGVRHKGNSSMGIGTPKLPLKIKFGEFTPGQTFRGLKMLVLNNSFKDPSLMREKLAYDLFREAGAVASRCAHARVTLAVGASETPLGLYTMVEHVDEVFLDEHFGGHEGNLYKLEMDPFQQSRGGPRPGGPPTPPGAARTVELKTNEAENDRSRLNALVARVADPAADLA